MALLLPRAPLTHQRVTSLLQLATTHQRPLLVMLLLRLPITAPALPRRLVIPSQVTMLPQFMATHPPLLSAMMVRQLLVTNPHPLRATVTLSRVIRNQVILNPVTPLP